MRIEDSTGGGYGVKVTQDNRLDTSSRSNIRSYYISRDDGQAYAWHSSLNATSGVPCLYIRNDSSTRDLFIHDIEGYSDQTNQFRVRVVTGTAVGSIITPLNLNLKSGNAAESTSLGNSEITGLTTGGIATALSMTANDSKGFDFNDSLILGKDDAIAVYCTQSGNVTVQVHGYFEQVD